MGKEKTEEIRKMIWNKFKRLRIWKRESFQFLFLRFSSHRLLHHRLEASSDLHNCVERKRESQKRRKNVKTKQYHKSDFKNVTIYDYYSIDPNILKRITSLCTFSLGGQVTHCFILHILFIYKYSRCFKLS